MVPMEVGQDDVFDLFGINADSGQNIRGAYISGQVFEFRCPACQPQFRITEDQLGSKMTCPTPGCNTRLKINTFVVKRA